MVKEHTRKEHIQNRLLLGSASSLLTFKEVTVKEHIRKEHIQNRFAWIPIVVAIQ
jgi:hypothetical protein